MCCLPSLKYTVRDLCLAAAPDCGTGEPSFPRSFVRFVSRLLELRCRAWPRLPSAVTSYAYGVPCSKGWFRISILSWQHPAATRHPATRQTRQCPVTRQPDNPTRQHPAPPGNQGSSQRVEHETQPPAKSWNTKHTAPAESWNTKHRPARNTGGGRCSE